MILNRSFRFAIFCAIVSLLSICGGGLVTSQLHASPAASIAFVQSTTTSQTSGQAASKAFSTSVTSGDLIIVGAFVDPGATVSVTDALGDTFSQVAHQTVASDHDANIFVGTAKVSGADTITVNAGSGKNVYAFSIHEYRGVTAVVDASATAQGNSTAAASGSLTTTSPNDLIFTWFTNGSNFRNENFSALNPSYAQREMSGSGTTQCYAFSNCVESGDLMASTTLTTSATATLNVPDIWSATAIAFKAASSITFVQSTSAAQTSGQTASKAFSSSVTSGDLIIVGVFVDPGATVSVTDALGDTFSQVVHQSVASDHDANIFVGTAKASGADTITVNAGSGKNAYAFSIHEYRGVTTVVDASASAQGNSAAAASGSLTTTSANDLIFTWFTNGSNNRNENFSSLSSAYKQRELSGSGTLQCYAFANCVASGDIIATTTLTTSATATLNVSDIWSASVIAFKGAGSASTLPGGGSTVPVASLSPTSLAFASQAVGATSAAQSTTLNNTSTSALSISSIALAGPSINDFALSNTCGSSLAAGAKCTISVTFKPTASGARSAGVTVSDNAAGGTQTVSLAGTGTSATPTATLSPTSLAFASQAIGATSAAQSATLNNTGTSALSISSITLAGANASDFAPGNTCGSSVAAGAKCTISVTFKPTASGARSAAVILIDNATGGTQTLSLAGTGASAGAAVSLSATSVAFGSQPISMTSAAQTITVTNTGASTLNITGLTVTGANASEYTQTGTCGSSIAAGANCTLAVMFTPSAAGARTAAVSIADNATGSPQTVSLSGSGRHDVILAWTASATPGVIGYNVYRGSTSGGESSTPMNSTPINGTTFTDQSATPGAWYCYSVTAIGSDGTVSVASNEAAATIPTP